VASLPTGTVTFLFTDIEGSTRLLEQLGDGYVAVRDTYAAIMRRAIAAGEGVEVGTEGDSFFAVFRSPEGAVRAAVEAQRELAVYRWAHGGPVRVRMGLHTGEGKLGGDDYVGIDVHRAARIAAAAHGGQVILSRASCALVEGALPSGVSLRSLGEHHLRDIARPEELHDLVIEGLPSEFPPPRTLSARPNNLPAQLTSFVGRERELEDVRDLLGRTRLLTLTGAGGTGKTRLALQVASDLLTEFRDGAFFVDLSSVHDPALVASVIAGELGVAEVPGRPILDAVKDHLRHKELLLVADNFEQLVDAAGVIEDLLAEAPDLKVIATSRVVLSLRGEQEYEVPPLRPAEPGNLPDLSELARIEAVRLFVDRAAAASPRFRLDEGNAVAVAELTARLDGLPLAIELAATRTKVLTPQEILPRLDRRLSILTSGPRSLPERQRTLRGAIAWSHDLLAPAERSLFARLSVFVGGWTLDAAEAVCRPDELGLDQLDGVTSLVDQSLIRRTEAATPRFSMLETIREFGMEQLETEGEADDARRRHAEFFLDLALEAEPHLAAGQGDWLDRCDAEHPNIRQALAWAVESGEAERAQGAAGALWRFWQQRGHLAEGDRWFEQVLGMPSGQGRTAARAKALTGAGGISWWRRDREAAGSFYAEALEIERELGEPSRIAEALYNHAFVVAGEDIDAAAGLLEESLELFRRAGDEAGVARAHVMLVIRDAQAGRWPAVLERLEEVVAIWRRLGDRLHLAFDLIWVAFARGRLGHRDAARSAALEALDIFQEVGNETGIGIALVDLAFLATWEGRHEDAVRLAGAFDGLRERVGGPPGGFAGILEGDPADEARPHLPADVAARAWDEGRTMSLEEAVALARAPDGA
jgi:predicted ATPase/class 3 adenylate cyclase